LIEMICVASGTISSHLMQIPNEPIVFADGKRRTEDSFIAYTWSHFLNHTDDPTWLARMPMTKAAVRAFDTIQSLAKSLNVVPPIDSFVVGGASKRGWTTWTTGAVDKRVKAIVPIVMPILNMIPNMNHQWQAYGNWSFALDDYLNMHLMADLNQPVFQKMTDIVDPFSYRDRLTMPKYAICSTGDEFFLPDSPQFFWDSLVGPKYLRIVPNSEHSLEGHATDIGLAVNAFYHMVITNKKLPDFSWKQTKLPNGGAILNVTTIEKPSTVKLWHANTISSTRRDFRLIICDNLKNPACLQPVVWTEMTLQDSGNGVYTAQLSPPPTGWTGFLIELNYNVENQVLKFTTEAFVVPDTLPFPPCADHCQQ